MPKKKVTDEQAKLGQVQMQAVEKAGGWVDTVFGEGFRQLGGAFADSMAGVRARNRIRVLEKTQKAIDDAGISGNTRPLNERLALPILEAIEMESDEALQNVWAQYIANAVNPSRPSYDRLMIDVIRRLEPSDLPVLRRFFRLQEGQLGPSDFPDLTESELVAVLDRLSSIGLLDYDDDTVQYLILEGSKSHARPVTSIGKADYYPNRLLRKLAEAIGEADVSTRVA